MLFFIWQDQVGLMSRGPAPDAFAFVPTGVPFFGNGIFKGIVWPFSESAVGCSGWE